MRLLLKANDLAETKLYYRTQLGFSVRDSVEATCTVEIQGQALIFTESALWEGGPKLTGTVYFFIDEITAYYESVKSSASVVWPLEEMSYGTREFGVRDCNGYLLAFSQRI